MPRPLQNAEQRSTPLNRPHHAMVLPLWEEHLARWVGPRQLQLQIPIIGWVTAPPFGYRVGVVLQRRWRTRALEDQPVESVAGNCEGQGPRRVLTLLVTFVAVPTIERRLDGLQMARDVRAAVRQAASVDRTNQEKPETVVVARRDR